MSARDELPGRVYVLETQRLSLRQIAVEDAQLVLDVLNDPSFMLYVGDRGVRTLEAARQYILRGPVESYARNGFGLYLVELKQSGEKLGICGLVKRDGLEDCDIGFALLPPYRSQGYALEAAAAVRDYARDTLGLARFVAIVSPENERSVGVLAKIGLRFERPIRMPGEDADISLYAIDFSTARTSPPLPIETARLRLRPFSPSDAEAFMAYRNDPAVARYQSWDAISRQVAESFVREHASSRLGIPGRWQQIAIALGGDDELVGDIGLFLRKDVRTAELGFTIAPRHQHRGYASEAVGALVEALFEHAGVERLEAVTDSRNAASIALLERLGFFPESSAQAVVKGEACTEHTYALGRAAWRGRARSMNGAASANGM